MYIPYEYSTWSKSKFQESILNGPHLFMTFLGGHLPPQPKLLEHVVDLAVKSSWWPHLSGIKGIGEFAGGTWLNSFITGWWNILYPYAPWMVYLPTFGRFLG
jgi:hypothetical protein